MLRSNRSLRTSYRSDNRTPSRMRHSTPSQNVGLELAILMLPAIDNNMRSIINNNTRYLSENNKLINSIINSLNNNRRKVITIASLLVAVLMTMTTRMVNRGRTLRTPLIARRDIRRIIKNANVNMASMIRKTRRDLYTTFLRTRLRQLRMSLTSNLLIHPNTRRINAINFLVIRDRILRRKMRTLLLDTNSLIKDRGAKRRKILERMFRNAAKRYTAISIRDQDMPADGVRIIDRITSRLTRLLNRVLIPDTNRYNKDQRTSKTGTNRIIIRQNQTIDINRLSLTSKKSNQNSMTAINSRIIRVIRNRLIGRLLPVDVIMVLTIRIDRTRAVLNANNQRFIKVVIVLNQVVITIINRDDLSFITRKRINQNYNNFDMIHRIINAKRVDRVTDNVIRLINDRNLVVIINIQLKIMNSNIDGISLLKVSRVVKVKLSKSNMVALLRRPDLNALIIVKDRVIVVRLSLRDLENTQLGLPNLLRDSRILKDLLSATVNMQQIMMSLGGILTNNITDINSNRVGHSLTVLIKGIARLLLGTNMERTMARQVSSHIVMISRAFVDYDLVRLMTRVGAFSVISRKQGRNDFLANRTNMLDDRVISIVMSRYTVNAGKEQTNGDNTVDIIRR